MGAPVLFYAYNAKDYGADGSGNNDSRWSSNSADDSWLIIDLEKHI